MTAKATDAQSPDSMHVSADVRAAITDLDSRWAWAIDHRDYEALREILAPGVRYVGHSGELHGIDEVIASYQSRTGHRTTRHGLSNQVLWREGTSTVRGESTWHNFASNESPPGPPQVYLIADFLDTYVRLDGSWRLEKRVIRGVFRDPGLAPAGPHLPDQNGPLGSQACASG
ncbi:nuclear transport factor 2 family protein [Cellulosimicrobium funkei]|nr:nuclear transport factor 2 family protein [Cellulosimicrobium funkei]